MRQRWILAWVVLLAGLAATQVQAGKVEIKGVHLCCQQCVRGAEASLSKVDGVSETKVDRQQKTVTFTAKDSATATAALKALADDGFYGKATEDGKALDVKLDTPKAGEKADEVTVKNVHLCCGQCKRAATALFPDAKVDYPDKNVMKISGKDLDKAKIIQALRDAGFNGKIGQ